ncbi:Phosphorylated carbohydrates phosphatase [bacterium HR17]|jgi:HAD superfamily hydrolase (TIGR01509 family)|uniref:Phosphorylated carbohydrates phosphatase n=1 Tax=Candidatus Fervidibacter japonicus TaxID=2035412 RepID=A0A2H5XDB8_9BACT|nr:Phosphorylated carbohydrates phosphatase [bacterium HR17]
MPVRALIFDFDGVLVDSERIQFEALQVALREVGLTLAWDDYRAIGIGLPDRDAVRLALQRRGTNDPKLVDKVLARKTALYDAWLTERVKASDGMANIVRALAQRFVLAIASGAMRHQIEAVLQREGVRECFAVIVSHDDYERGKPDPTPFLLALERLNEGVQPPLRPHECVVVEDAPAGVQAARAAGMRCVAVTTYFEATELCGADVVIGHFADLLQPKVWERLGMPPLL